MRRTVYAMLGTALGTILMIAAKLGTHPAEDGVDLGLTDGLATVGPDGSPLPVDAGASPMPGQPQPTSTIPGATPGPGAPTTRPPGPTTAPPPPPPAGLKNGTFPGSAVSERYGTIKVTILVSGGRITDVTATYPTGGETGTINAKAIPKLRSEALTAQSASIATVSGATYTSQAYKTSLQSAINAAKA
jgi:uncharacterized protein with FMN-binding domain